MHVFVSRPKETNKCIPLPDAASESHDPKRPDCPRSWSNTHKQARKQWQMQRLYQNSGKQLQLLPWDRFLSLARAALEADFLLLYTARMKYTTYWHYASVSLNNLCGNSEPSPTFWALLCNIILAVCLNFADRIAVTVLASRQDVPKGSGFAVLSALEYEIEAAASSAVY